MGGAGGKILDYKNASGHCIKSTRLSSVKWADEGESDPCDATSS